MPRTILFNADDWGLSQPIHEAVVSLHRAKGIDAASIMMGQRYSEEAVRYAKRNPDLRVGPHLFANDPDCTPLTLSAWPRGWPEKFMLLVRMMLPFDTSLVIAEAAAQLRAYRETGLRVDFINSHFQFHAHRAVADRIREEIAEVFPDFRGWLRLGEVRLFPVGRVPVVRDIPDAFSRLVLTRLQEGIEKWTGPKNDTLWGLNSLFSNRPDQIAAAASKLGEGFHEFFFHPGRHWKLEDNGTDHAALLELADLLPQAHRVSSLSNFNP